MREKLLHLSKETPALWALLGFAVYFYYAQFIVAVMWNAIELIIAQHLIHYGTYATSIDYPSAITWRPVLPTLLVAFLRLFTQDPVLIYQIFCGSTAAVLTISLFFSARRLAGIFAAHAAAFLTLSCPAVTTYLVNHMHSYSHLGALLVLGPTLMVSLRLLVPSPAETSPPSKWIYALGGFLWGLACLCRAELLLFAGVHLAFLLILHFRGRHPLRPLYFYGVAFLAILLPYNIYAGHVAHRDGVLMRKTIYAFYISQGWADRTPASTGDIEADGYLKAIHLYGDPLQNHESLITAIWRNKAAFLRRVRLNAVAFCQKYRDEGFFPPWWSAAVILTAMALACGLVPARDRIPIGYLLCLFLASLFILIFHIDARYLTINVPPLLLLTAYFCHLVLAKTRGVTLFSARIAAVVLAIALICTALPNLKLIWHHRPRNQVGIAAMRTLGLHFRRTLGAHPPSLNREPHIGFTFPDKSPLWPEDYFLLDYFSETAWTSAGADGAFPRGKFYSFRDCPEDYAYVPATKLINPQIGKNGVLAGCDVPGLGRYYLLRESAPP